MNDRWKHWRLCHRRSNKRALRERALPVGAENWAPATLLWGRHRRTRCLECGELLETTSRPRAAQTSAPHPRLGEVGLIVLPKLCEAGRRVLGALDQGCGQRRRGGYAWSGSYQLIAPTHPKPSPSLPAGTEYPVQGAWVGERASEGLSPEGSRDAPPSLPTSLGCANQGAVTPVQGSGVPVIACGP